MVINFRPGSIKKVVSILLLCIPVFYSCTQAFSPTQWTGEQGDKIRAIVNTVSVTELSDTLNDLNGIRNVAMNGDNISVYENAITSRFNSYSLVPEKQEVLLDWALYADNNDVIFVYGPYSMNNLIAVKPGTDPEAPPVLYTAHWDSHPRGPGIDDNATGCAAVLEGARVLAGYTFRHTIIFVIFAFEEDGVIGSKHYARNMTTQPKAVINLDMIGFTSEKEDSYIFTDVYLDFPRTGDFIGIFATDFSAGLGIDYIRAIDEFVPGLKYYLLITDPNLSNDPSLVHILRSDHAPFWEKGIPAIMVTDTAFLREGHPYHTSEDTIDKIDFMFMFQCVQASIAAVCIAADIR